MLFENSNKHHKKLEILNVLQRISNKLCIISREIKYKDL